MDPSEKGRSLHANKSDIETRLQETKKTRQLCTLADGTDATVHQPDGSQQFLFFFSYSELSSVFFFLKAQCMSTGSLRLLSAQPLLFFGVGGGSGLPTVCFNIWPPND